MFLLTFSVADDTDPTEARGTTAVLLTASLFVGELQFVQVTAKQSKLGGADTEVDAKSTSGAAEEAKRHRGSQA